MSEWETSWLQKDLEHMSKRLGVVLDQLNKKTTLTESLKDKIEYALDQRDQNYGMKEEEAIHFRMRKVFSILDEISRDIERDHNE